MKRRIILFLLNRIGGKKNPSTEEETHAKRAGCGCLLAIALAPFLPILIFIILIVWISSSLMSCARASSAEMMLTAYGNNEADDVSFRSIESFLYRVSKVFEEKRPIGDQGQAMDRKMYVKLAERNKELGLK